MSNEQCCLCGAVGHDSKDCPMIEKCKSFIEEMSKKDEFEFEKPLESDEANYALLLFVGGWQAARAQSAGEAVAYEVTAEKPGLKMQRRLTFDVADASARAEHWKWRGCAVRVRPLIYGDTAPPAQVPDVAAIMEKAQEFASAWASVGGRFDDGSMLEEAETRKAELRAMLTAAPQPKGGE